MQPRTFVFEFRVTSGREREAAAVERAWFRVRDSVYLAIRPYSSTSAIEKPRHERETWTLEESRECTSLC